MARLETNISTGLQYRNPFDNINKWIEDSDKKDLLQKKLELDAENTKYQRGRDALQDARYDADKAERLSDKFDARQKEIATNEALGLIGNKDEFLAGKVSAENKAYADALSQVSDPIEKARLANDIKNYQSGAQKKDWENAILGQSNIDSKQITNLRRDMAQDEESKRRFDLQMAESRAARNEAKQDRIDRKNKEEYENRAAAITAEKMSTGEDTYSTKVESGTGKIIVDPLKEKDFNIEISKTSEDKDFVDLTKKAEDLSSKILTPEQEKDENLRLMWEKEYGDKIKQSGVKNIASTVASDLAYKYDPAQAAKENLSEFLQSNTRDPIFGSREQNANYDKKLKELQQNVKQAESMKKNATKIQKDVAPSFDEYKKSKILDSNSAKKELDSVSNQFSSTIDKKINNLLKSEDYGVEEKEIKNVPLSIDVTTRKVFNETYAEIKKNNPGIPEYIAVSNASKAAKFAGDQQEKRLDEFDKRAATIASKKIEKEDKQRETIVKSKISEIERLRKDLQNIKADDKDRIIDGKELDPEDYSKYLSNNLSNLEREFANEFPEYKNRF